MSWWVTYERKVRYSDTDAQGIVFNANYSVYFDDCLTDLFELIGFEWGAYEIVLRRVEIDFRSPGRLGETLVTGARVERIGTTSLTILLATWEKTTGRAVAEGTHIQVVVSGETLQPVPAPSALVEAIEGVEARAG